MIYGDIVGVCGVQFGDRTERTTVQFLHTSSFSVPNIRTLQQSSHSEIQSPECSIKCNAIRQTESADQPDVSLWLHITSPLSLCHFTVVSTSNTALQIVESYHWTSSECSFSFNVNVPKSKSDSVVATIKRPSNSAVHQPRWTDERYRCCKCPQRD